MTAVDVLRVMGEQNQALADKGTLLLTVQLDSPEQAAEIMRWMYSPDNSPMQSKLMEIAWDKVAVRKDQAEAIEMLRKSFAV